MNAEDPNTKMNATELIARVRATLSVKLRTDRGIAELAELALQLASALERALAEREWQPIETAPRDALILVWCPERKNTYLVRFRGGDWRHFGGMGDQLTEKPTHWMHRPNPPTT